MTAEGRTSIQRDPREAIGGAFLRLFNPLVRRMIPAGIPTGAPNVLLTVRGRKTGLPRTIPVGVVRLDGRRFIQSAYGDTGWVQNVRASGEATMTDGYRQVRVQVVELPPEKGGAVLRSVLVPYRRSRLLRVLFGPRWRPPIGVLWRLRVRVDETLDEYIAEARRHPVFELRPQEVTRG